MTKIEFITERINAATKRTEDLLKDIPTRIWLDSPQVLNTNLNWQIGHLSVANYLHGIASISGANEKVREKLNVSDYVKFYGPKSNPLEFITERPDTKELLDGYRFILELAHEELQKLGEDGLSEKTNIPNPSAQNKYEALNRLFEHQNWHNGQIAMLKRVLKENNKI